MGIRKNFKLLKEVERKAFVDALLELKKNGTYDDAVQIHLDAMAHTTPAIAQQFAPARNSAHRGPAFLPWHREYILRLERALQSIDSALSLPYWDWTQDAADPVNSPIWAEDFMGGNGDEENGWIVNSGPFAKAAGNWDLTVDVENGGTALKRRFGRLEWSGADGTVAGVDFDLPKDSDVKYAMTERHYDAIPYNDSQFCTGFRNRLEGWIRNTADLNVRISGTQLHNRVHVFVGGAWVETENDGTNSDVSGTMLLGSSPNDPIFFLHHCFIDKLWADWQRLRRTADPAGLPHYAPLHHGPLGHNLYDGMFPWGEAAKPANLLDHTALGYEYDTDSVSLEDAELFTVEAVSKAEIIQIPIKSPFL